MAQLAKTLHVLAVGLWFGTTVFFSFLVTLSLFATFGRVAEQRPRPVWFPLAPEFAHDPEERQGSPSPSEYRPESPIFENASAVRREQGIRAAGAAIGPIFDWYFPLQGVCAVLALATTMRWPRLEPQVRAHRLRVVVLILAFATVLAGWPLERYVATLRAPRDEATDAVLRSMPDVPEQIHAQAVAARRSFGVMHGISTTLNLGTIALVTIAMALAARLPASSDRRPQLVGSLERSPEASR